MNKRILIISTGGTILSTSDRPSQLTNYTLHGTKIEDVLSVTEDLQNIRLDCRNLFSIPSSCISFAHWKLLCEFLENELRAEDVLGAVVAHGTDTLEESAFFINLFLKSDKPVVFTGAMRPNNALGSDGPLNLFNSIRIVMSTESKGKGVLISLNGKISEARLTTKTHTLDSATFQAPEYGFCGYVINDEVHFISKCLKPHTVQTEFEIQSISDLSDLPFVPIIYAYACEGDSLIQASITSGAKGIIYAGTGHGTISKCAEKRLKEACDKGILVVRASRTTGPVVESKLRWKESGFIPAGTLNCIKARLLLSIGLAVFGNSQEEIERIFKVY